MFAVLVMPEPCAGLPVGKVIFGHLDWGFAPTLSLSSVRSTKAYLVVLLYAFAKSVRCAQTFSKAWTYWAVSSGASP